MHRFGQKESKQIEKKKRGDLQTGRERGVFALCCSCGFVGFSVTLSLSFFLCCVAFDQSDMTSKNAVVDSVAETFYGRTLAESLGARICVKCGTGVGQLRDGRSAAEYQLSGLCQACQDAVFDANDDTFDQLFDTLREARE